MPPRPAPRAPTPSIFEGLTAVHSYEKFKLELTRDELSMRALDMIAPIGRGQRGLIVAPPRTGKTMLLQKIAKSVLANHPEVVVMVLLVDERPEEVTDFKMQIGKQAEIVASSNDNPYRRHIEVTEQVIDKASRFHSPTQVDTKASFIETKNSYIISASGGVLIDSWDAADQHESSEALTPVRAEAAEGRGARSCSSPRTT